MNSLAGAHALMGDDNTLLFLSAASLWEIAIKVSTSKLILTAPFSEFIPEQLAANYINILPIEVQDLSLLVQLPFHRIGIPLIA